MSNESTQTATEHVDVVIVGAGLAGLSLARQLLLRGDELGETKRILLVDKRAELPEKQQKVGEATVQVSGYYFSKVLGLEEHLLREHYMKYNLRFHWHTTGRDGKDFFDYTQAYIRTLSNLASYQLDRNKLEAELLRLNLANPRCSLLTSTRVGEVLLGSSPGAEGPASLLRGAPSAQPVASSEPSAPGDEPSKTSPSVHRITLEETAQKRTITCDWIVDCTGRGRVFAHRLGLLKENAIHHGSSYLWVDGLLDIEKLTARSAREIRLSPERASTGHLPFWLATNHFMGEGFWFWVIPLQGKTSLGLVFDRAKVDHREVATADKLIAWICRQFPLFERDLPHREVLHFAGIPSFSYDCTQTISAARWALSGMSGRFTDPLYSPGGDLIAIYNTLITDAIHTADAELLAAKVRAYEQLMRAVYEAYVPSYAESYETLGDAEAFVLRYTWELAVYFAFYVFPFINDLFTDRRFLAGYFNRFGKLGPINRNLHRFLAAYYRWAKREREPLGGPLFHDFPEAGALAAAEKTFYRVGLGVDEAKAVLHEQFDHLEELARYELAYLCSIVVGDRAVLLSDAFVGALDPASFAFEPERIRELWASCRDRERPYPWRFCTQTMEKFRRAQCRIETQCRCEQSAPAAPVAMERMEVVER